MSEFTSKVHLNPGGDVLVVESGGKIEVQEGGEVSGLTGAAALATASATVLGGIKAAAKGAGDTVECKIDESTSKLYVAPYSLPEAAAAVLGGVKAAAAGVGDTVECKIDGTSKKLFVPAYPTTATEAAAGLVKAAANQAAIAADAELAALRTAYIDLILKLKAAGIMEADSAE